MIMVSEVRERLYNVTCPDDIDAIAKWIWADAKNNGIKQKREVYELLIFILLDEIKRNAIYGRINHKENTLQGLS